MGLIGLLIRTSRRRVVFAIAAGLIAGFSGAALAAIINTYIWEAGSAANGLAWAFAGLCFLMGLARFGSDLLLIRLSQEAVFTLRMELCRRICAAPLLRFQAIGPSRLLAALTEDVNAVAEGILWIPPLCINVAIVAGGLVYLGWLSVPLLLLFLAWMVLGIGAYRLLERKALEALKEARDQADVLYEHFRALLFGIKELKLHHSRREAFRRDRLEAAACAYRARFASGRGHYAVADSGGTILFYLVIGLFLFAAPAIWPIPAPTLTGYVLVLLYMMAPLEGILNSLPVLGRAKVALEKVESLGLPQGGEGGDPSPELIDPLQRWERLELAGVTHSYLHEKDDHGFLLGPIDFTFRPGELVFLIGGNGSGKTTLALLLAGLYVPESGEIRLDGKPISDPKREGYRQLFSAVFSDCYLFEDLLGLGKRESDHVRDYLVQLQLDRKVEVRNGAFSTVNLSQGQRKRLALLTAFLEDRPFYIFDEWAADQDPLFKKIFYTELLPRLKTAGKTVLVITHDDRYFHVADRCVSMEFGKIISVYEAGRRPTTAEAQVR